MERLLLAVRQTVAFVRRETAEVLHQPMLVLVLVVGPFGVMLLFGVGYRNEPLVLRTMLVADEEAPLVEVTQRFEDELGDAISLEGVTEDLVEGSRLLQEGRIDLLVILPTDPAETVLAGERANITVLHEKLDPIQQVAVDFASRLATDEINAAVLAELVSVGQTTLAPADELLVRLEDEAAVLADAAEDNPEATAAAAVGIADSARLLAVLLDATTVVGELDGETPATDDETEAAVSAAALATRLADAAETLRAEPDGPEAEARALQIRRLVGDVATAMASVETIDPSVLVRPFTSSAELLTERPVQIIDFFAPAAVALLIAHLGVSVGALSFVRDERLGLVELYRVGPVGAWQPLLGKFLAFGILAALTGGALLLLVVRGLDVPALGPVSQVVAALLLVVAASVAMGLVLSLLAGSDSQAVQFSMLVLLASLFFSGFILDLERLRQPALGVSAILPVTYGTRMLREVMLLGRTPRTEDIVGLVAITVVGLAVAALLVRRRLRVR